MAQEESLKILRNWISARQSALEGGSRFPGIDQSFLSRAEDEVIDVLGLMVPATFSIYYLAVDRLTLKNVLALEAQPDRPDERSDEPFNLNSPALHDYFRKEGIAKLEGLLRLQDYMKTIGKLPGDGWKTREDVSNTLYYLHVFIDDDGDIIDSVVKAIGSGDPIDPNDFEMAQVLNHFFEEHPYPPKQLVE